jgi:UDP-N-acetylmuramate dehydrogenase
MLILTDFQEIPDLEIKQDERLSRYTFTKVGGPADFLAFPQTVQALSELLKLAKVKQSPVTILGNASNLIVRDGGIRGIVILLEKLNRVNVAGFGIEAQAGANLKAVTQIAQQHALTGLEFASGIPGSIGGAVFMNAGAYGGEIAQVFSSCKVMDKDGKVKRLQAPELNFGYRYSTIRDKNLIVLSAKFDLRAGDPQQIQFEMERLTHLRELKQPLEFPSCGSVFKRPMGHYAGQLIQEADLQGFRMGGVEVSTKHAGFMVNVANGSATDYEALIAHVIETVYQKSGVVLEPEVRIIGERRL